MHYNRQISNSVSYNTDPWSTNRKTSQHTLAFAAMASYGGKSCEAPNWWSLSRQGDGHASFYALHLMRSHSNHTATKKEGKGRDRKYRTSTKLIQLPIAQHLLQYLFMTWWLVLPHFLSLSHSSRTLSCHCSMWTTGHGKTFLVFLCDWRKLLREWLGTCFIC